MGTRDMTMWNGYGDVENGYESNGFHGEVVNENVGMGIET